MFFLGEIIRMVLPFNWPALLQDPRIVVLVWREAISVKFISNVPHLSYFILSKSPMLQLLSK